MLKTISFDDDIALALRQIQKSNPHKSLQEIVNETLREGLKVTPPKKTKKFTITPFNLGFRENLNLDKIEDLLDQLEGSNRK